MKWNHNWALVVCELRCKPGYLINCCTVTSSAKKVTVTSAYGMPCMKYVLDTIQAIARTTYFSSFTSLLQLEFTFIQ